MPCILHIIHLPAKWQSKESSKGTVATKLAFWEYIPYMKDSYIDNSPAISELLFHWPHHHILRGQKGSGKSTFLKLLRTFLDRNEKSELLFSDMKISKEKNWKKHLNKYSVVYMDFSDFRAESYKSAVEYFNEKMQKIFIELQDYFIEECTPEYNLCEYYIDIMDGKFHKDSVKRALRILLRIYEHGKHYIDNLSPLAILIDNISQTEFYAKKYGYSDKMKSFIKDFLGEEYPIKIADIYVQVGDYFLRETQIDDFYDYYEPHCVSYFCQEIFPDDIDSNYLDEHFCIIQKLNSEYFSKTKNLIEEKRQWINYEKLHKKEAEKLAEIIERKRYAKRISKTLIRPSTLIGLRKYSIEEHNQTYNELNDFLKSMYDSYITSDKKDDFVYKKLQNADFEKRTDWTEENLEIIKNLQTNNSKTWESVWTNGDSYWSYIGFRGRNKTSYISSSHIKLYATLNTINIKNTFLDSIRFLVKNGTNGFSAKISKYSRNDQMCYWVRLKEYTLLQQFFASYQAKLISPMRFIAYKNGLGISHELNITSHNSLNAEIIQKYFKLVQDREEIALSKMISLYVLGWNGKLGKKHPFSYFKQDRADAIVVLLETLDLILGRRFFNDTSILLNDTPEFWDALSSSVCWCDFEERYVAGINNKTKKHE